MKAKKRQNTHCEIERNKNKTKQKFNYSKPRIIKWNSKTKELIAFYRLCEQKERAR